MIAKIIDALFRNLLSHFSRAFFMDSRIVGTKSPKAMAVIAQRGISEFLKTILYPAKQR
jgi:hypothetical protein